MWTRPTNIRKHKTYNIFVLNSIIMCRMLHNQLCLSSHGQQILLTNIIIFTLATHWFKRYCCQTRCHTLQGCVSCVYNDMCWCYVFFKCCVYMCFCIYAYHVSHWKQVDCMFRCCDIPCTYVIKVVNKKTRWCNS